MCLMKVLCIKNSYGPAATESKQSNLKYEQRTGVDIFSGKIHKQPCGKTFNISNHLEKKIKATARGHVTAIRKAIVHEIQKTARAG